MSAAEMREAAAKLCNSAMERYAAKGRDASASYFGREYDAARDTAEELSRAIRALPLPDEEGMVKRVARAICEAPPRTVETADGTTVELAGCPEPGACKLCSYGARAAIRAINGGEP